MSSAGSTEDTSRFRLFGSSEQTRLNTGLSWSGPAVEWDPSPLAGWGVDIWGRMGGRTAGNVSHLAVNRTLRGEAGYSAPPPPCRTLRGAALPLPLPQRSEGRGLVAPRGVNHPVMNRWGGLKTCTLLKEALRTNDSTKHTKASDLLY